MIVIGHRGAAGLAPENTRAAFQKAVALGLTAAELDVHLSADGQLVVIHDATLDRTTDGRGAVHQKTAAQLAALDAGAWFDRAFVGERIPTLEAILSEFAGRLDIQIEIKEHKAHELPTVATQVAHLARVHGLSPGSSVISFHAPALEAMRAAAADIPRGLLGDYAKPDMLDQAVALGCKWACVEVGHLTAELVTEARGRGLGVTTWTANEPAQFAHARACAVDAVTTDYPDRALAFFSAARA